MQVEVVSAALPLNDNESVSVPVYAMIMSISTEFNTTNAQEYYELLEIHEQIQKCIRNAKPPTIDSSLAQCIGNLNEE
jgi:hypothetical protein